MQKLLTKPRIDSIMMI